MGPATWVDLTMSPQIKYVLHVVTGCLMYIGVKSASAGFRQSGTIVGQDVRRVVGSHVTIVGKIT